MGDELQARLRRADPAGPHVPVDPAGGPRAAILQRTIMSMDDSTQDAASTRPAPPLWRRPLVMSAVGAAAAAAVVTTVVAVTNSDDPGSGASTVTYALDSTAGGPLGICVPVADIEPVAGAAALAGTVAAIEGLRVVLDVHHWYAGGNADQVELTGTPQSVALDGVEFVVGDDYLVTAADGVVQPCGVSGPATDELEDLYEQWYG